MLYDGPPSDNAPWVRFMLPEEIEKFDLMPDAVPARHGFHHTAGSALLALLRMGAGTVTRAPHEHLIGVAVIFVVVRPGHSLSSAQCTAWQTSAACLISCFRWACVPQLPIRAQQQRWQAIAGRHTG